MERKWPQGSPQKRFLRLVQRNKSRILCLQETKAHEDQLPEEVKSVAGYTSFFLTPEKKGYSGVGLYPRKLLRVFNLDLVTGSTPKVERLLQTLVTSFYSISIFPMANARLSVLSIRWISTIHF
ncbi:MAG: hypothetical protein Ct9H300mP11_18690 [Chloroflexota bacterium]|nr:MAG: hypothetical protein Ct9H300mP11_18690 [Chloroflexota bacterium]